MERKAGADTSRVGAGGGGGTDGASRGRDAAAGEAGAAGEARSTETTRPPLFCWSAAADEQAIRLARRLGGWTVPIHRLLGDVPALRSHYLAVLRKP